MRILVMFDLPMKTKQEVKNYTKFVKELKIIGAIRIQYSIYCRFARSTADVNKHIRRIKKILPSEGNIRILVITEKQFENMVLFTNQNKLLEYSDNTIIIE